MLAALATVLALQGAARIPAPAAALPVANLERLTADSLEAAELSFFYQWGDAYFLSADFTRQPGRGMSFQSAMIECTPFHDRALEKEEVTVWKGRIQSERSAFAVCPSWPLVGPLPFDESKQLDAALDPRFHESVRRAREMLIGHFTNAVAAFPRNDWIVGQLVRLLVDQGDLGRALSVSSSCHASTSWCESLVGLTLTLRGNFAAADSAFERATRAMPVPERCRWTDAASLLDSAGRAAYESVPCEQRDSANAILWWLADPLWMESGNERRAVQYARRVAVDLRRAVRRDERWSWEPMLGGDALAEMVLRYGWPTYTFWPGLNHDRARTGRYLVPMFRGAVNPPYTSFEYSPDRLQTLPPGSALRAPFEATVEDLAIGAMRNFRTLNQPDDTLPGATISPKEVVKRTGEWWWPQNHFRPSHIIGQMNAGESVFLRRDTSAIFATLVDVPPLLQRSSNADAHVALFVSTDPDHVQRVAGRAEVLGETLTLFGEIPARRALAGVEILSAQAGAASARNRYGIAPPPSLNAMPAGMHALSDIVMIQPPGGDSVMPKSTAALLGRIRKTQLTANTDKFAIYWESYGFRPTDTVDVAVWVERYTSQGILRNLGVRLNIVRDLNTPIAISWNEPGIGRDAIVVQGRVPIVGRTLVLDASMLEAGDYWLDVVVKGANGEPVRTRRPFTKRK